MPLLIYSSSMESSASSTKYKRLEDIAESLLDWQDNKRCQHFSFIMHKKRIVAIGSNHKKTHPLNLKNKKISDRTGLDVSDQKYTCSEFNAITKLKRLTNIETKRCTLINIRYDRTGKLAEAKPCMSCQNLLKYFEFKKIVWTNSKGEYQEQT